MATLFLLLLPTVVAAEISVQNLMEADAVVQTGPRFFDYQDGAQQIWDVAGDWNSGTLAGTTQAGGSVTLTPGAPPFELCINSGGPNYTAVDGTLYTADQLFTGGGTITWAQPIANTLDDPMFQTIRYAFTAGGVPTYTYAIPVPSNGAYSVEVGMLESFNNPPYQNQTDLTIEGVQVLDDFDPFAVTGGMRRAIVQTFNTTVTDGTLDMLIAHAGWYGAIANFCVRGAGATGPTTGTWTSAPIDTSAAGTNVFGVIGAEAVVPAGTNISFQLGFGATAAAAAAGPFVGPDDTSGTSYAAGDPIGYAHDFTDRFVAVQATLTTTTAGTTPSLDRAWISWDLAEITSNPTPLTVASSPTGQKGWLVRVWPTTPGLTGTTATLSSTSLAGGAAGKLQIGTDHPTTQIQISTGSVLQASGPAFPSGPGDPHSISIAEVTMAPAVVGFRWEGQLGGILVNHDFLVTFS